MKKTITHNVNGVDNISIEKNYNLFYEFSIGEFFRRPYKPDVYVKINCKKAFNLTKSLTVTINENTKVYIVNSFEIEREYKD